jgi:hypothetical protein
MPENSVTLDRRRRYGKRHGFAVAELETARDCNADFLLQILPRAAGFMVGT